MAEQVRTIWRPQAGPQHALIECPVFEIFYGGARGGGKTDGMLGKWAIKAQRYGEHAIGVFFRRSREDLREAIERSKQIYGPLGATYTDKQWTFPNGARLKFQYLDNDKDAENYQGHNYTDLFFEEIQHWPDPAPVWKLKATLRSAVGVPTQFHATGNPGGPGHNWVKSRYITPAPLGYEILDEDFTNPFDGSIQTLQRVFIPSKLTDNPLLLKADPLYIAKLQQSGSEQLVRAWLKGDWDVIEGAYFDHWSNKLVIRPLELPAHWTRFRSFDWGSARPFSVGWWAIASEDFEGLPKNALVRYREWYGCKRDANGQAIPNTGLKLDVEQVADGILKRGPEKIKYSVADPAIFAADGGPSMAERFLKCGITFRRADNKRVAKRGAIGGWDQMRSRIRDGMIYTFSTCVDSIRTIPVLQHDSNKPEDLDTDGEDHAADEWRYACMSRPYSAPTPTEEEPIKGIHDMTLNELYSKQIKQKRRF